MATRDARRFAVVSQDGSGLGWALRLQDEGEDVTLVLAPHEDDDSPELLNRLGEGLVQTASLEDAVDDPERYWIFSENAQTETAMALRNDGQKVFGAMDIADDLEHDRSYAMQVAEHYGLALPDVASFSDMQQGVSYLQAHPDQAYVFKPDDAEASHLTFVPGRDDPKDANLELQSYLAHLDDPSISSYVLQERKRGIEACFCWWLDRGVPILGEVTLENKRQLVGDWGENGPCAHDVVFTLPIGAKCFAETAAKLSPLLTEYTGFLDLNVIIADQQAWFLETGCRYGYNAHPNLFMTLATDPYGELMADWMDGRTEKFDERFRRGFGASISLRLDHPRPGLPVSIRDKFKPFYYAYDLMQQGDQLLTTGYSHDLGVYARHGYTIQDAGEKALSDLVIEEAVSIPDMAIRTDIAKNDYPGSPQRRYDALDAMGWLR